MQELGYACSAYAESLSEFGTPRQLVESGGWLLERAIPDTDLRDAIGCYPIFSCSDWSRLHLDFDALGEELVSLSMVPDPFGDYDVEYLRESFRDLVVPFKQHYVIDMERPLDDTVSRHHKVAIRKAQRKIQTEVCLEPHAFLDEWITLHQHLVRKHSITGVRAFSRQAFAQQLQTPGIVVLVAKHNDEVVGAQLWIQQRNVAFGHVLAFTDVGYKLGASYALYWFALNYFSDKVRWCDIGGVAGNSDSASRGLHQFKEGWTRELRTAYFCGRILNPSRYNALVEKNAFSDKFFPAYRQAF
jgi:GNAT acetyltransferase-like protein